MKFTSIDPATGGTVAVYDEDSPERVHSVLVAAHSASCTWSATSHTSRREIVERTADVLDALRDELAHMMTVEMGKPLSQARAEVDKCSAACRYLASVAATTLASEWIDIDGARAELRYDPMGVVLAIMPWNFPLWQFIRFAAPAILAGNAVVLKHAPNVMGSAQMMVSALHEAGVPFDLVQHLRIDETAVARVIADPRIRAVTFTGSTRGGSAVAALAGAAVKKTILELGGNDPYIVFGDADIAAAVEACVRGRMVNSGQSCIAAKRFLVHASVLGEVTERLAAAFDALRVGDPMDEATEIGPLARRDLRDGLLDQVERSRALGARVLTHRPQSDMPVNGWYVAPMLLTDASQESPLFREELFGPVAGVWPFTTEEEAVAMANDSRYGLAAAVFTQDPERASRIATQLHCGTVAINDFVRSDMRLPFGGVKDSGYGRELGTIGLREFTSIKVIR
jgi:succinate-semialdehyde dehydrogenase/glutarate-semialdehyde dehydrogenase